MSSRIHYLGKICVILLLLVSVILLGACTTTVYENPDFIAEISPERTIERTIEIQLGEDIYIVEVADSIGLQMKGLSGRSDLQENGGMLFSYDSNKELYFWMKDTNLLLSIAFLLEDGKIVSIQDMFPNSNFLVHSVVPVRYALELPMGAFEKAGVRVGDVIDILH
jgi:uncharacterized protein